ncbi:MAG: PA domain-containing protein [Acidobacteriota bacterium]
MRTIFSRALSALLVLSFLGMAASFAPAGATTFVIVNNDGAGEGFNDATVAAPVGGNMGTTVGQQRLNAFQFAADLWGSLIDSDQTIYIQATFDPLTCTATSAVLGSAGALQIFSDFPGADFPATWYAVSLANKLSGTDLAPGPTNTTADDIIARFNSSLNGNVACLGGIGWYYGFDAMHGANTDLVTVLLHEFGHGLGFANFVTESSGANAGPPFQTDVYSQFTRDNTLGQTWAQINPTNTNDAAIQASAIRCGKIVWTGPQVTSAVAAGALQAGAPFVRVNTPAGIAGFYQLGSAAFGPALTTGGVTGNVVIGLDPADGAGPSTTDGCTLFTNAAAVLGNIALVDRGTCGFTIKVKNAQLAGATAVIVADNVAGCPPASLGGTDATIIIPSGRVSLADGNTLKANIATLNATLLLDPAQRAGADSSNRALLAALNPVAPGSSISHWDASHFPNSLMEPAINADLNPPVNDVDLTFEHFQDIGWFKLDGSIAQVDSADPVLAGTNYTYTVTATNGGSGTDRPLTVTNTLPAGSTYVSATGTGWTCNEAGGIVTCSRDAVAGPNFPTGPAPAITITVTAGFTPGIVTNTATINVLNPLLDPDFGNNTVEENTTIISPSGLVATKSVSGTFEEGGTITYTVVISNGGPGAQANNPGSEFTDVLPPGLTLVSASATSGTAIATVGTNTVSWDGAIPANSTVTITITATIKPGTRGSQIVNQGNVAFDADGNGTNESSVLTDDPSAAGATNPTPFLVGGTAVDIPTVSGIGFALLFVLLAGFGAFVLRRRRADA